MSLTSVTASDGSKAWSLLLPAGESGDEGLERALLLLYVAKFLVMAARHRKYGPLNIAMSGRAGLLTRIRDKIARIENGELNAGDETYSDTLLDLANYADILHLWEGGDWPSSGHVAPICRGCGREL